MFEPRELTEELDAVREEHTADALVFETAGDFETLPAEVAENLLPIVDSLDPLSYPEEWLPEDAPETLRRISGGEFTIGAPGDGGIAWTRQTDPPAVFIKPRLEDSPEGFVELLIAEAFVEVGLGRPERFLGFFEDRYTALDEAIPLSSADTYQLAAALFDAYVGLHTREVFTEWHEQYPGLYEEWVDAGERLEPRLSGLSDDVASGRADFADASELACAAVKHDVEVPTPFAALDTSAYREHGADFAVRWAEKTFEALSESR
jgi:hypothetical protein